MNMMAGLFQSGAVMMALAVVTLFVSILSVLVFDARFPSKWVAAGMAMMVVGAFLVGLRG